MQLIPSHGLDVPGAPCLAPSEVQGLMEERFATAVTAGHALAVLACELVGLEALERADPARAGRALGALAHRLEPAFQVSQALVLREERGLLVLLVGPDPERLEDASRAWAAGARELPIEGLAARARLSARIGCAVTQPRKRLFLETLILVAREGLHVARCRGAGACVHTRLYDILQDRLERERGVPGIPVAASTPVPRAAPSPEPGRTDGAGARAAAPLLALPSLPSTPGSPAHASAAAADREHELARALEAERRANEALRARLESLEQRLALPAPAEALAPPGPIDAGVQERIELLERRIAKLTHSLAQAEERLARGAHESALEPGIASRYRTVQGLDPEAPDRALKAALMEAIFAANLELQECLRLRKAA